MHKEVHKEAHEDVPDTKFMWERNMKVEDIKFYMHRGRSKRAKNGRGMRGRKMSVKETGTKR